MVLPEQYSNIVTARMRYYVWQFKESPQQAAFALDDYKKGLKYMKSNLFQIKMMDGTEQFVTELLKEAEQATDEL